MVITVFGLGFVGLTTSLGFSEYGHTVYGVEINAERLATISGGKLPFLEPGLDEALVRHLNKRFFPIGTDALAQAVKDSDCIYFCVGTPYGKNGQADLAYLFSAIDQTLAVRPSDKYQVLVVKKFLNNHIFHEYQIQHKRYFHLRRYPSSFHDIKVLKSIILMFHLF